MSGSGRRSSSKWDLKEESRFQFENIQKNAWPGKAGLCFHDKESQRGWLSPKAVSGNSSNWSILEPLPGRRGSRRADSFDEDPSWDREESYGTRMSPGLDEWRQQNYRNSPKNELKRSRRSRSRSQSRGRSRSPVHGFERESGLYDRSKSRSDVSTQLCKDFAAGRCSRGNHCPFFHQGPESYEDGWERPRKTSASKYPISRDSREYPVGSGRSTDCCTDFLEGSCRKGASCRFPHHGASHVAGKGSSNEGIRERNDRRHRDLSSERRGDREFRRAADVPCKFFAAGSCRNGKHCRFSHQVQAHASPDRSQDARCSLDQNSDDVGKLWNGPKWRSTSTSDAGKLCEDKNETIGAPVRGRPRAVHDGWSSWEDKIRSDPSADQKLAESEEPIPWKTKNGCDNMLASEQRPDKDWLGDMDMSPEWNYKVQPSNHFDKQEHTLTSCNHGITLEASGQVPDATAALPPMINESSTKRHDYNLREVGGSALPHDDKSVTGKSTSSHNSISADIKFAQSFNPNGPNANALPLPGLNTVGQGQVTIPSSEGILDIQNQTLLQEGMIINKPEIGETNVSQGNAGLPVTQKMVSSKQLNQLTNISASLAQLLANGQQLPQLYAVHNSQGNSRAEITSFTNSDGSVKLDSVVTIQSNHNVGLQKYDPICDSFQPEQHDVNNNPPGFSPAVVRQKNIADGKPEMSSKSLSPPSATGVQNGADCKKLCNLQEPNGKSYQLNEKIPGSNSKCTKENITVNEESRKAGEETVDEDCPLENIDGDGKTDEGKKGKDVKGIRAFKFALVEFVKELLKPTWKEGQMSKDAYKNIVKKVVDKVTGTMQGTGIPQTQEKIKQYLSFSKPKLTKLVQAYVEKFQKDK